jgi:protein-tyrosine phosphatase
VHYLCSSTVNKFFKYLFHKEKSKSVDPFDLKVLGTDVHSHLLPGIDDGSPNMEESIHLIRSLHEFGYKKFITTPHIFKDIYPNTPEIILEKLALVRAELKKQHIQIELDAAAEYYLDEHFEEAIEKKNLLTFGKNYVLYELSFASEPITFKRATFNLHLNGYKPVLAHPERYQYWHKELSIYENLHDQGVFLQLNLNCLTDQYGKDVRKVAEWCIERDLYSFVGTDCHHMGHVQLMEQARKNPYIERLLSKVRNTEL